MPLIVTIFVLFHLILVELHCACLQSMLLYLTQCDHYTVLQSLDHCASISVESVLEWLLFVEDRVIESVVAQHYSLDTVLEWADTFSIVSITLLSTG